jgi:hypothetical protein
MWKTSSVADELFEVMQQQLLTKQASDNTRELSKIAQAVDFLNQAAEILDRANMTEAANDLTKILEGLVVK